MLFYHVDRTKLLKPNQIIDYENLPPKCNQDIIDYCQNRFQNKLSRIGYIYTSYSVPSNSDYSIFTSEIFLELYRQQHFPNYPSRFQSICACDSIDQAHFWIKEFSGNEINNIDCNIAIFQSDKFFKADASWRDLIAGNLSISTVELWSKNYWTGKIYEKEPRIEYLLPLPIKIEDVIYSPFK